MTPNIEKELSRHLQGQISILGFGNRLWGDDGAGSHIAEALKAIPHLNVVDGGSVPENHLEAVLRNHPETILLIDAGDFGGAPGEARLISPDDLALTGLSTHAGSPQVLARYLNARCQARVMMLVIQAANSGEGQELSAEVATTADQLVELLKGIAVRADLAGDPV
jgi:hydrogenase 3 maturation protease